MNLFEVLLHPDQEERELKDRTEVIAAANVLQVGEFQLLQLAYFEWHGRDMVEAEMNRLFSAYMIENAIPHWARDFARKILARAAAGDRSMEKDPAYHRYDTDFVTHVDEGKKKFVIASVAIAAIFVIAITAASMTNRTVTSILPPYFEVEDLLPQSNPDQE